MFENSFKQNFLYNSEYNNFDNNFPFQSLINDNDLNIPFNDDYFNKVFFTKSYNCSNIIPNLNLFPAYVIPTESKTDKLFLFQKIKRTEENDEINNNEEEIYIEIKNEIITNNKLGRRKRDKKYYKKANHTKFSKDNIIRKIKTRLFDEILIKLNKSIKFKSGKFKSLNKKTKENLKKSANIDLLNMKIKNIFANTALNKRDEKIGGYNKKLIEKIYDENKEKETIYILEIHFQNFLNDMRNKYLEEFLQKIRDKEIKVENKYKNKINEDFKIDLYMEKVKESINKYEEWFEKKIGRKRN